MEYIEARKKALEDLKQKREEYSKNAMSKEKSHLQKKANDASIESCYEYYNQIRNGVRLITFIEHYGTKLENIPEEFMQSENAYHGYIYLIQELNKIFNVSITEDYELSIEMKTSEKAALASLIAATALLLTYFSENKEIAITSCAAYGALITPILLKIYKEIKKIYIKAYAILQESELHDICIQEKQEKCKEIIDRLKNENKKIEEKGYNSLVVSELDKIIQEWEEEIESYNQKKPKTLTKTIQKES